MGKTIFVCLIPLVAMVFNGCATKQVTVVKTEPKQPSSVVVIGFTEGSNLKKTEAREGDEFLTYDGNAVTSIARLGELKKAVKTPEVELILKRGDEKIAVTVPKGQIGVYLRESPPDHAVAGDAVVIEGIGGLSWGVGKDNSFFGALSRIDEKFGDGVGYIDMLGLSGYGFRSNFFKGWCPSSPDATCGRDVGSELLSKLGYEYEVYFAEGMKLPDFLKDKMLPHEQLMEKIRTNIDNGWPVLAIDLIEVPEWGIVTGYQNEGKELFCRTYFDKTRGYEIAKKAPWVIFLITGKEEVDLAPEYRKSLDTAKELYEIPQYDNYFSGKKAIEEWIAALRDEEHLASLSESQVEESMHANWWIHTSLYSARSAAGLYLSKNRDLFGVDAALIDALIEVYKHEQEILKKGMATVPSKFSGATAATWTGELRAAQADNLQKFFELEKKASEILAKIAG